MGIGSEITLAELEADPDPILARMRATEPVCWVPSMDMWLVTRWDDVAYMEAHPELFSAATDPSFLARALGPNMLVMDPPAHTRLRDMMLPPFQSSGRSGAFVSAELAELADGILDEIEGPTVELMGAYAQPLTAGALAIVLGLDSHGFDRMWSWCEGLVTDIANFENDPTATAIGEAAKADLGEAIAARIEQAAGGDSAIDRFVQAGATSAEIVNNLRLMISGGINEPRDGVGLVAWVLLSRPDLRQAVAVDGRRLRRLVEEVLRVHSPVGTITRQATRDLELAGAAIAAGDLVSGVLRSINLDPEHWSNPTEIDLRRREGPHAAFALGVHRCLGEWLGRQEVRVGVERLLARFPDMALVADRPVELQGFEFRGPREVWVTV
ncbi:MAG: cytochrome P450 [Acidimicrobiia bacterium]|nr:cytochrome P450 [Acidimicrobiia bacterium]